MDKKKKNEFFAAEKRMIENIDSVIRFLVIHHCNTESLRKSVKEYVELVEIEITDLSLEIFNLKEKIRLEKHIGLIESISKDREKLRNIDPGIKKMLWDDIMSIPDKF